MLRARGLVLRALRTVLDDLGFLEVHPPVLVSSPALEDTLEAVSSAAGWLHTSPEFALKRVLAAGLPRIYSIVPCFRDEEHGRHHRREFMMLELYLCNAGYLDLIPIVERLIGRAAVAVSSPEPVWRRVTVADLFDNDIPSDDDLYFRTWVDCIEPSLTAPTFVLDYPARHAALAELRGTVAERVEVYLAGMEIGNGYTELRDPTELEQRFAQSARARERAGRAPHPTDAGVIAATARFPRAAGIALGLDRLVMALLGETDIARVIVAGHG